MAATCLVIIVVGLVLVGSSWPQVKNIEYVLCDAVAKTCTTEERVYKVGSEGALFMGIFIVVFGLAVLLILLSHYIKYMFSVVLKAFAKALRCLSRP